MIITDVSRTAMIDVNMENTPLEAFIISQNLFSDTSPYQIELNVQHMTPIKLGDYDDIEDAKADFNNFIIALKEKKDEFVFNRSDSDE